MPHVERAGYIRRRNDEGEYFVARPDGGVEDAGIDPPLGPTRFKSLRLIDFLKFHGRGKYNYSRGTNEEGTGRSLSLREKRRSEENDWY
jgi:hypothetical protein